MNKEYLEQNGLVIITTKSGTTPVNQAGATISAKNQYPDIEALPYFDEKIGAYVLKIKETEQKATVIHTPKKEEVNCGDAIKRLEDTGMQMASKDEALDYLEEIRKEKEAVAEILAELKARQFLDGQEKIKLENRQNEIAMKEAKIFEDSLKKQPKINMTIQRKRNKEGVSMELKTSKFNPITGALELDGNGKPITTEYIVVIINNKRFGPAHLVKVDYNISSFDLGPDVGGAEGLIMLNEVPWCVACALAEKRPTHKLINPLTGEIFKPPFKGGSHEFQRLLTQNEQDYWQHRI